MMYHDNYKQISITIICRQLLELLHFEAYRKSYSLVVAGSYLDTLCYPCDQLVVVHLENILFFSRNLLVCTPYIIRFCIYHIFQFSWDDGHKIQNICLFLSDIFLLLCIFNFISHISKALLDIYYLTLSIAIVLLALSIYLDDHNLFFFLFHIFHICCSLFDRLFYLYDNDHIYHRALYIFFHHIRDPEHLFQHILVYLYIYHLVDNNLSIYILFFISHRNFYFCFFLSFRIYQTLCNLSSISSLACEEIYLYTYHHSYQKNSLNTSYRHSFSFQTNHIFWRPKVHPSTYRSDLYDNVIVLYCLPFHTRP